MKSTDGSSNNSNSGGEDFELLGLNNSKSDDYSYVSDAGDPNSEDYELLVSDLTSKYQKIKTKDLLDIYPGRILGNVPVPQHNDDLGNRNWFARIINKLSPIVCIRVVVLDGDKHAEAVKRMADYITGYSNKGSPYTQEIEFDVSAVKNVGSTDQLRFGGTDHYTAEKAFTKRISAILMYTIRRISEIELYTQSEYNDPQNTDSWFVKKIKTIKSNYERGEYYDITSEHTRTSTKQIREKTSVLYMQCLAYLRKAKGMHGYYSFLSNADLTGSDTFTAATKSMPSDLKKTLMKDIAEKATAAIKNVVNSKVKGQIDFSKYTTAATAGGAYGESSGAKLDLMNLDDEQRKQMSVAQCTYQIFDSSQYSKSFSFSINAIAQSASHADIIKQVYLPFFVLMVMGVPEQIDQLNIANMLYVQVDVPNIFSTDLGILTSVTRTVLPEYGFNEDGLPLGTRIDVSVQDLYSGLGIPTSVEGIFMSPGLLLFLNNILGVSKEVELNNFSTHIISLMSLFQSITNNVKNYLADKINGISRKFLLKRDTMFSNVQKSSDYNKFYTARMNMGSPKAIETRLNNSIEQTASNSLGLNYFGTPFNITNADMDEYQKTINANHGRTTKLTYKILKFLDVLM